MDGSDAPSARMETARVKHNRARKPTGSTVPGSSTSLAILNGLLAEVLSIEQFAARQDSAQLLPLPRTNDAQGAEVNAADWFAELAGEATVLRVFVLRSAAINVFLPRVVTRETAGSLLAVLHRPVRSAAVNFGFVLTRALIILKLIAVVPGLSRQAC